ncbi:MAG: hypothetical protein JO057_25940 [Chloroflexi bacterium]|nr:hypothetical protein [Chloroflexota bacterium]
MSNDDLNTLLQQFSRAMIDPTAPLPTLWPAGAMGVFLVFVTQIGAGIPVGVLMARNAGINPLVTAGLYAASDVVLAIVMEPMLILLRWMGHRVEFIGRLGNRLARLSGATGLSDGNVRGPLGLILFSFAVAPAPARAASEAAGHGFISGWTLAIIGDMFYFTLIMASTLWVSSLFGDDRLSVGAVLIGAWVLPMLFRRLRRGSSSPRPARVAPPLRVATASANTLDAAPPTSRPTRKTSTTHNGRRRRASRGLHH